MIELNLLPHPDAPPGAVDRVRARFSPSGYEPTAIEYRVFASGHLILPAPKQPERRNGLWKTTCFELFVQCSGYEGYQEF
ncbi:hypothetical protein ABTK22_19085, partial [Acinetobacter baumannii]